MAAGASGVPNIPSTMQGLQGASTQGQPGFMKDIGSGSTSAAPGFMQYQGQGQPNQPQGITPGTPPPAFGATPQNQNFMTGPDATGNMPGGNEGFDSSGSDGGVGGQPAPMQSPLGVGMPQQQGNKPLSFSQFQQPQGLQIQGNPSSQVVQRPQQR